MITISFKVTEQEARIIKVKARRQRVSVSEFLRRQARAQVDSNLKPKLQVCPMTGAKIFSSTLGGSPLTVESTRDLLTDFP